MTPQERAAAQRAWKGAWRILRMGREPFTVMEHAGYGLLKERNHADAADQHRKPLIYHFHRSNSK